MDEEGGEPIYGQAQGLRGERLPRQQVDRDVNPNLNHKNGPLFGLELTYKGQIPYLPSRLDPGSLWVCGARRFGHLSGLQDPGLRRDDGKK